MSDAHPNSSATATSRAGSLDALLSPRSIAIVGATDRSRWAQALVANLEAGGYDGQLHMVNRRGGSAFGRTAAVNCGAIGAPVDMGIVVVPQHAVAEALEDLAACGARSDVLMTSGFAETGEEGARAQVRLLERARAANMRLLGPNSLGVMNFAARMVAWTAPVRLPPSSDGVAIVSQSGATAYFLTEMAWQTGIGVSAVVATGNEADIDAATVIDHLVDDPHTRAIALFAETVRHPERFVRAARRAFAAAKPLVVLKVGISEATARAASAHTGALVGDDRVFDGLCRQLGMIRVRTIDDLLATADIAGRTGVLRPGGLAIISNSGGICEVAADLASARGMNVPPPTPGVEAGLRAAMPGFGTPHNPLDLTGGIEPPQCGEAVRLLGRQDDVAAVMAVFYPVPNETSEENERQTEMHRHLSAGLTDIPVPGILSCYTPARVNDHSLAYIERLGVPYSAFGFDRVVGALCGAAWWSERQRAARPAGTVTPPARSTARPASEHAALAYLREAGVPVVPAVLARSEAEAVAAAARIGAPAVLKIASPDIAHKSEVGGVALNVEGEAAVRAAWRGVTEGAARGAPAAHIDGVLVAPMRGRGIELIVGVARDPLWGPVLAVGLGGIWVEIMKDVALRPLPVDAATVHDMLGELRGGPLLDGARGVPAADRPALVAAILAIARAAEALGPELAAMDINPLWVRGTEVEALDALFVFDDATGKGDEE